MSYHQCQIRNVRDRWALCNMDDTRSLWEMSILDRMKKSGKSIVSMVSEQYSSFAIVCFDIMNGFSFASRRYEYDYFFEHRDLQKSNVRTAELTKFLFFFSLHRTIGLQDGRDLWRQKKRYWLDSLTKQTSCIITMIFQTRLMESNTYRCAVVSIK